MHGGDRIAQFHRGLGATIASVTFPQVDAYAVNHDLAFVEFRSDAMTTKGDPYGNYYIAKCVAHQGRITHWVEFFDPRPAEMMRRNLAESLAARHAGV